MDSSTQDAGPEKSRRPAFLTTRFLIIAASVIVLGIVGTVIAVSANVAALSAQADREAAQIVNDFNQAATTCTRTNSELSTAVADAEETVTTDPSSLADPALIDDLRAVSSENSEVPLCVVPTMATDSDSIEAQTTLMRSESDGVSAATESLQSAIYSVTASVQEKVAAAAAEAAAAEAAARTWPQDGGNGYTYDVTLAVGPPTSGATASGNTVGSACTDFNPATDIAVPYTVTVTSTTQNFTIPSFPVQVFPYSFGGVGINNGVWYVGDSLFSYTDAGTYEAEAYYSGGASTCWQPATSSSAGLLSVQFNDGLEPGATRIWNFTFIVKGYKSPSFPGGNPALLSSIGLSPKLSIFWVSGDKALTLDNSIIQR